MKSDHSTHPDQITGWSKREPPLLRQFPLIFVNAPVDIVTKSLTTFGNTQAYRVVYMGPRHCSNMKAFKSYCASEKLPSAPQSAVYSQQQLPKFTFPHQEEPLKFFPIRISEYRLFTGPNPTLRKDDLRFDSDFQSGNLDLAIYVNPAEYDLLMRVDSNTKGHAAWFYFKVSNAAPKQKIKFNILNFSKKYLLYKEGMKPYVFRKSAGKWSQEGLSVNYAKRKFRYEASENFYCQSLSFYYQFKDSEDVYFAYCVPYSYSFLIHRIQQHLKRTPQFLKVSYDNQSTGGLPIPVLTITNFSNSNDNKATILCTGRLHPGETQGSWMMDGFIEKLLSPDSHYLRDRCVFKIVPMVNVDGVVLGNFRTGIMGRDLNRVFNVINKYNEIDLIRSLAEVSRPETFIDFHGHSSKKNVFIYGPDYRLEDRNYLMCRLFPKLISKQTEAFRYYSCLFKISPSKLTTGRAIMLRQFNVDFAYTVEASTYGFGPVKDEVAFDDHSYMKVGSAIAQSLTEFVKVLRILPIRKKTKLKVQQQSSKSFESNKSIARENIMEKSSLILASDQYSSLSVIQKNLLREIMKEQADIDEEQEAEGSEKEDSDCEDQSNDYSAGDIKNIMSAKFDPEATSTSSKRRKLKEIKEDKNNGKKEQKSGKKKQKKHSMKMESKSFVEKNKSLSKVNRSSEIYASASQELSETIDVSNKKKMKSFESKVSKIFDKSPNFMEGIVKKQELKRGSSEGRTKIADYGMDTDNERDNNVHYEWPHKKEANKSSKHFKFTVPEMEQRSKKKVEEKREEREERKKMPMFSIKKSVLPMLGKTECVDRPEKSMLSEILEEHERRNKVHKNVRIMFL